MVRLIPREERFFDLFVEDAANVLGAARLLEAMLKNYDTVERRAGELRDAEHRGDEISHDIGHRLENTFITPFDREDIHALISGLDDVIDLVEEIYALLESAIDKCEDVANTIERIVVKHA